jgi:hypothetical protein
MVIARRFARFANSYFRTRRVIARVGTFCSSGHLGERRGVDGVCASATEPLIGPNRATFHAVVRVLRDGDREIGDRPRDGHEMGTRDGDTRWGQGHEMGTGSLFTHEMGTRTRDDSARDGDRDDSARDGDRFVIHARDGDRFVIHDLSHAHEMGTGSLFTHEMGTGSLFTTFHTRWGQVRYSRTRWGQVRYSRPFMR